MTLSIRKATRKDAESLRLLLSDLAGHPVSDADIADRLRLSVRNRNERLFVCEDANRIVGVLGFRIRENIEESSRYGEISAIVVESTGRKQGVGRFMMDYAEGLAKELGCKGTWLVSGFGREEVAHKFYKDLGYRVTGYRFVKLFEREEL